MKKYILILLFAVSALVACNNNFLEKLPVETLTESTAFSSYSNFQTYAWSLYGVFDNANILRKIGTYGDAGLNVSVVGLAPVRNESIWAEADDECEVRLLHHTLQGCLLASIMAGRARLYHNMPAASGPRPIARF